MAELADALDLGSSGATRAGSIPVIPTEILKLPPKFCPKEEQNKGFFTIVGGEKGVSSRETPFFIPLNPPKIIIELKISNTTKMRRTVFIFG